MTAGMGTTPTQGGFKAEARAAASAAAFRRLHIGCPLPSAPTLPLSACHRHQGVMRGRAWRLPSPALFLLCVSVAAGLGSLYAQRSTPATHEGVIHRLDALVALPQQLQTAAASHAAAAAASPQAAASDSGADVGATSLRLLLVGHGLQQEAASIAFMELGTHLHERGHTIR